ncbi:MAG: tyrosine-type recombinase/integrase [Alphaproteobacteria bacterium]|nr:tyrosine-type recombinase/integrase [Alphaproteobacteria bacterium]
MADMANAWVDLQKDRVSAGEVKQITLETRAYNLQPVVDFMGEEDIAFITPEKVVKYKSHRRGMGVRARTIGNETDTLKAVLNYAKNRDLIDKVPKIDRLHDDPAPPKHLPTEEELGRIVDALSEPTRSMVWLLAEVGCRLGEATNLTWARVDLEAPTVTFWSDGTWSTKNDQSNRTVPISNALAASIDALPRKSRLVFPSRVDPELTTTDIQKRLNAAIEDADIRRNGELLRLTAKDFRVAYITRQAIKGAPISITRKMVGHKPGSRVTEEAYTKVQDNMLGGHVSELPVRALSGSNGQHAVVQGKKIRVRKRRKP